MYRIYWTYYRDGIQAPGRLCQMQTDAEELNIALDKIYNEYDVISIYVKQYK